MRIKFVTSVAGARFAYRTNEEADLPEDVAAEFIAARQAVPLDVEEAVLSAPENAAAKRRGARRQRGGLF